MGGKKNGLRKNIRTFLQTLGPGLITGASDDDPSGIATYSQVGAQFGMGMLWTMIFTFPLMTAIQQICARIGRVTGRGIAGNIRRCYPRWTLYVTVAVLLVANTLNLAADIGAMGSALRLLLGGSAFCYSLLFAALSAWLQVVVPYSTYVFFLKWLTLALFAYVITAFVVGVPWLKVAAAVVLPPVSSHGDYLKALVALFGTTLSPYLFFWQASEEVEEVTNCDGEKPLKRAPRQATAQFNRIRIDTYVGMALSNLVAFFIILTTAVTLHAHGLKDISTADQAALALKPLAGRFSFLLFALGIIGTGLLAVPVLAGSAAYAVGEAMNWPVGLERSFARAKGFYVVIALATLLGGLANALNLNPIKALFLSAVLNGVVAGPLMVVMMLMASNPKVMGQFTLSAGLRYLGWLATGVMFLISLGMFLVG